MPRRFVRNVVCLASVITTAFAAPTLGDETGAIAFEKRDSAVVISVGGQPVAEYVFHDAKISRPYLTQIRTRDGQEVTRHYPPLAGRDRVDHPEFHPGIWMSFGDLGGCDYWRLKAATRHERFDEEPDDRRGSFAVRNKYLEADGNNAICEETCRITVAERPQGYLICWDSTFESPREFWFGDQEEMGLGIRIATELRVERAAPNVAVAGTGEIRNAEGLRNEAEVARKSSMWCDYHGQLDGEDAGITIFCHPDNFRASWFHARDYGLLVANPFARKSLAGGEPSKIVVAPGEQFRLRYGLFVHRGETTPEQLQREFSDYVTSTGR